MNRLDEYPDDPLQERFARFLQARAEDPDLDIESWARETPDLAAGLRRLYGAWSSAQGELGRTAARSRSGGDARTGDARAIEPSVEPSIEFGYEVLEELGRGGFGRVLRARDRALGREVAVKVIEPEVVDTDDARRRFVAEARSLARVDHENVVRVHAVEPDGAGVRLVLELVRGRTLADIVEQEGRLGAEEAAQVGAALCRGLAAVHARGLLHLDVKPGNVMRAADGRLVLLDFGFARERSPERGEDAGRHGGTPPFMAPEHLLGRDDLDQRADVFSLGVTLYWCVAGRYPYDFRGREELFQRILDGALVPLRDARPDVPAEFAEVLERATATDPSHRYASVGELESALRGVLAGGGAATRGVARGPSRRALLAVGGLALAAVAAVPVHHLVTAVPLLPVEATFFRGLGDAAEPIAAETRLVAGDEVSLEVRGEVPFYLYLFNQDADGNMYRLAPEGEPELLAARVVHRLPGPDRLADHWFVDQQSEREHLLLLASTRRDPVIESIMDAYPTPSAPGPAAIGPLDGEAVAAARTALRGLGGLGGGGKGSEVEARDERPLESLLDVFDQYQELIDARVVPRNQVRLVRLDLGGD